MTIFASLQRARNAHESRRDKPRKVKVKMDWPDDLRLSKLIEEKAKREQREEDAEHCMDEPLSETLCALCGWPFWTHRSDDLQCLRKPRFVAMKESH